MGHVSCQHPGTTLFSRIICRQDAWSTWTKNCLVSVEIRISFFHFSQFKGHVRPVQWQLQFSNQSLEHHHHCGEIPVSRHPYASDGKTSQNAGIIVSPKVIARFCRCTLRCAKTLTLPLSPDSHPEPSGGILHVIYFSSNFAFHVDSLERAYVSGVNYLSCHLCNDKYWQDIGRAASVRLLLIALIQSAVRCLLSNGSCLSVDTN